MAKNKFNFEQKAAEFKKLKNALPKILGNQALNFFLESFDKGGFNNTGFQKWPARKPGAPRNEGRGLLIDSGDLKRSIKSSVSNNKVTISSDLIYAEVHNYGLRAGRGTGFKMPQRKFMGKSFRLEKEMKNKISKKISGIFK